MNDREYPKEAGAALNTFKDDLIKELEERFAYEWKNDDSVENDCQGKECTVEWDGFIPYGCEGKLPYTPEQLHEVFKDNKLRVISIDECKAIDDVQKLDDESKIESVLYGLPFPLSDREFICFNLNTMRDGTVYLLNRTVTHSSKPDNGDYQRGRACIDIKITSDPSDAGASVMKVSILNDMAGLLPAWLQNQINKIAKTYVADVRKAIGTYLKETGKVIQIRHVA